MTLYLRKNTIWHIGLSRRRKPPSRIILYKPKNRRKKYGLAAKPPRITFMASRRKKCSFLEHTCRSSRLSSSFSSSSHVCLLGLFCFLWSNVPGVVFSRQLNLNKPCWTCTFLKTCLHILHIIEYVLSSSSYKVCKTKIRTAWNKTYLFEATITVCRIHF